MTLADITPTPGSLIVCLDANEGENKLMPVVSFVAISPDKQIVVWCDLIGEETTSIAATELASHLSYTLRKMSLYRTDQLDEHVDDHLKESWKLVQSFRSMHLLLQDKTHFKKCMSHVSNMLDSTECAADDGTASISSTSSSSSSGSNDDAITQADTQALHAASQRPATQSRYAIAVSSRTRSSSTSGSKAVAQAVPTALQFRQLDANDVNKNDWNVLMAALCLPSAFVDLNATKDPHHPLIMRKPQNASFIQNKECPGTTTSSKLLNKAFVKAFLDALSRYVKSTFVHGRQFYSGGKLHKGQDLLIRKGQVINFNATQTDENKKKQWQWIRPVDIKYPTSDGTDRLKQIKKEGASVSKAGNLFDLLAYLDFVARFACWEAAALLHGDKQEVFWDRTEIDIHEDTLEDKTHPLPAKEGHFFVFFVLGGDCTIRVESGNGKSKRAKCSLKDGSVCVLSGKSRWQGHHRFIFPDTGKKSNHWTNWTDRTIVVKMIYVIVPILMRQKMVEYNDPLLDVELTNEIDESCAGGMPVLAERMSLFAERMSKDMENDPKGNKNDGATEAQLESNVSEISDSVELKLPGVKNLLVGEIRGNSTTYINFFDQSEGCTLKCGVQVWQALYHTQHKTFIGFGLPMVLRATLSYAKYVSKGFTPVCSGYVVWKNSVVTVLITFVHEKTAKKDFMVLSTTPQCLQWTSQKARYEWEKPRFPAAAAIMQRKWVDAMDSAYKRSRRSVSFIESPISVKNIGSPPVILNPTTPKRKSTAGSRKKKPVEKKRNVASRAGKTDAAPPVALPTSAPHAATPPVALPTSAVQWSVDVLAALRASAPPVAMPTPAPPVAAHVTEVQSHNTELQKELIVQKLKMKHVEDTNPLTNALELERERQKSTLRELELTKIHHKELLNLVTDTAAKREKDLMNSTASSTQAMQPYQGFPFAQFAAALPDARTQPGVYPPGVAVAPAAAPGYEQYMAQLLNQGKCHPSSLNIYMTQKAHVRDICKNIDAFSIFCGKPYNALHSTV